MIDARATLDPAIGIARATTLVPPAADQPLWTVAVDIGGLDAAGHRGLADGDYPLHLVGAAGLRPGDAMLRGAGEAVERFALRPGSLTWTPGEHVPRLSFADPAVALGSPAADPDRLAWLPGRDLASGEEVAVPAALVDYPAADGTALRCFDPTPSGAAAGAGTGMALRNALHEIVERDAVMVAWAAQLRLERIDLTTVAATPAQAGELARLTGAADALGLAVTLGAIPTCLRGIECIVAILVDRGTDAVASAAGTLAAGALAAGAPGVGHPLAAVGARASACRAAAAVGAFREAFQVRAALRGVDQWYGADTATPTDITGDLDRARLWTTPAAVAAVERWTDGFVAPRRTAPAPAADRAASPPGTAPAGSAASVEELVADLRRDGARPVAVRLTHRLPPAAREMGWEAVKVIPVGLHALRMDERHAFTWLRERIATASRRLDRAAGVPEGQPYPFPHPLI
jgi:ribosomal protein S12 methylthiotransferase accessory factor